MKTEKVRINNQIRANELRVVTDDGALGVMSLRDALKAAQERGLDLIEIAPNAEPPVAKITDYGKFQYDSQKKAKEARAKAHTVETKIVQVKIGTGEHDLKLKASKVSEWLQEGHRIKVDLFLAGRAKYTNETFKKERLDRILALVTEPFIIADPPKPSPKGFSLVIERARGKAKSQPGQTQP